MRRLETDVAIVGAGPVGLVLAMELARRGVESVVVELRKAGEPPNVKCNHVSARSMEILRGLGIAGEVRAAGLPRDFPHDASYRTTVTGPEIARIPIPSPEGRRRGDPGPDTDWPTPEPPHRINQTYLEPILFRHASAQHGIRILDRTRADGFTQDADGVTLAVLAPEGAVEICARYLVGCDGGRSGIRKAIGATLQGDAVVQRVQSTYFRAPDLIDRMQEPPVWSTIAYNPRRVGTLYAIDGRESWLLHNYLREDEADFDAVDRDWALRTILGVGDDFSYEVLSREDWFGRRLVTDKIRESRVFICGDAAHIWVPYAGYGMNAGIADAHNLAWQLGGVFAGWAPEAILDAHAAERGPITEQVSRFAMRHSEEMAKKRRAVPSEIEDDTPAGEAARGLAGQTLYDLNVQQYCCGGLNFGYYYDASPIIADEGTPPPHYTMQDFTPSTVPGCRAPHFSLRDGRSIYDVQGTSFALIRTSRGVDVRPLVEAAERSRLPLIVIDAPGAPAAYDHVLTLVRPDQHVAWRGKRIPDAPEALIDLVRGAG